MEQFNRVQGIAAPLMRANIDTDLLIPSKEMTGAGKQGYGEKLLAPWRYLTATQVEDQQDVLLNDPVEELSLKRIENPEFVLNRAPFRKATVLIAGANFGSGSSREQAVWAIRQFGFRCVIAPSFGTIFRNNCYRNGVLPVVLPEEQVQTLAQEAESGQLVLSVDLSECVIFHPNGSRIEFVIPPGEQMMMLEGLDAIGLTFKRGDAIEAFQRADRVARPWIWAGTTQQLADMSHTTARAGRRALLLQAMAVGACAVALPCQLARAQALTEKFPTKPVQLIVPYPPGGSNDNTARLVAKQLAQAWGQSVVIDNKPGAGGVIGAAALARSAPDGHTLALVSLSFTTSAAAQPKLPFDPVKDFVPVARAGSGAFVILVSPKLDVKNLNELVAMARKAPGRVTFGSSGVGSSNQFATELFMDLTGVRMTHVPYKGMGPAMVDLAGGHLNVVFATLSSAQALLGNRSVRALAATGAKRIPQLPDIPTAAEAGIAGYQFDGWSGFLAPAATPPVLVTFLNASINRAMASPEVAAALAAEGMTPFEPLGPEAFRKIVLDDLERWKRIAKERGIRAE